MPVQGTAPRRRSQASPGRPCLILRPILERYASERDEGERFGDFVIRAGYVAETRAGREFHDDFKED